MINSIERLEFLATQEGIPISKPDCKIKILYGVDYWHLLLNQKYNMTAIPHH